MNSTICSRNIGPGKNKKNKALPLMAVSLVALLGLQGCGSSGGGSAPAPAVPTLTVAAASVVEGHSVTSPANTADFAVTLTAAASSDITVTYSTGDSTTGNAATADTDYISESNATLVIPAGSRSGVISITVTGDDTIELDESFNLLINSAPGTTIDSGSQSVVGTILSDDSLAGYYTNFTDTKVNGPVGELTISAGQIQVIADINRMAIINLANDLVYIVDISALNPADFTATAQVYKDGDFKNTTNVTATFTSVGTTGDLVEITLASTGGEDYSDTNGTMTLAYDAKNGIAPLVFAKDESWFIPFSTAISFQTPAVISINTNSDVKSIALDSCNAIDVDLLDVVAEKTGRIRSFLATTTLSSCSDNNTTGTSLNGYFTTFYGPQPDNGPQPDDSMLFIWFNDNGVFAEILPSP